MWYNTIPTISATAWLFQVVDLLDHTLRAVLGQPVLAAFVGRRYLLSSSACSTGPERRSSDGLSGL